MQTLITTLAILLVIGLASSCYLAGSKRDPVLDAALDQADGDVKTAIYLLGHVAENDNGEIDYVSLQKTIPQSRRHPLRMNDGVLRCLSEFNSIKTLIVGAPNDMTDVGMAYIAKLNNLERLNISLVTISDRGLKELSKLQRLKHLTVDSSCLSDKAISEFENQHPDCLVRYLRLNRHR